MERGAAKAVAFVLKEIGIKVLYVSRQANGSKNHFAYTDVNKNMLNACKLLVNCTPLGMFPQTEISVDIPFNALSKDHLVIDLIYNPEKTLFLERAQKQQATILNGASMLKEQAMESWRLWNK